jgi:hypothetical protein
MAVILKGRKRQIAKAQPPLRGARWQVPGSLARQGLGVAAGPAAAENEEE